MLAETVAADKADLGREVRRDAHGGGEWRKRRTHAKEREEGARRGPALYSLSPLTWSSLIVLEDDSRLPPRLTTSRG